MPDQATLKRSFDPDTVRRQYAHVAWFYDAWGRLTEDKALGLLLEKAIIRDGSDILEVAVGTGRLFARMAALNLSGHMTGVDLSSDMLAYARRRMARQKNVGSYDLREASAYDLPFEDASFDLVANSYMLDLLPVADHPRLLAEFARVLRPGGRLMLAWFSEGTHWYNRLWLWLAKHFPALLTDCRPVRLEDAVTAAGFHILDRQDVSQMTFPSTILVAEKKV
ncbi:class I SAM-dependent methyltransferase [Kordiimonas marina]|uniref:class I SAM-dependent methyltransferase n=1 Tax=Kordiimonas marina TaxID=2872312 RepID=UPI001FF191F5|nr:methyltransferase domain-containing protein [Kordiimonas marina]MCJ9430626.1 methyltransferase domain-containing protein [Kordiimonas marina]